MCDDAAVSEIKKRIEESAAGTAFAQGIHFIDSGNYHYMSAIITGMITEPFSLVVLDHHPDMQAPMFGAILSCGGWVLKVLEDNPYVRDVHIIGADRALIDKLDESDRAKVSFYDISDVRDKLPKTQYPVFLSVDKDVVRREELVTNWDQGEMPVDELISFIKELVSAAEVIGADICGECSPDQEGIDVAKETAVNDELNLELLKALIS